MRGRSHAGGPRLLQPLACAGDTIDDAPVHVLQGPAAAADFTLATPVVEPAEITGRSPSLVTFVGVPAGPVVLTATPPADQACRVFPALGDATSTADVAVDVVTVVTFICEALWFSVSEVSVLISRG